jgi:hypothetical protein
LDELEEGLGFGLGSRARARAKGHLLARAIEPGMENRFKMPVTGGKIAVKIYPIGIGTGTTGKTIGVCREHHSPSQGLGHNRSQGRRKQEGGFGLIPMVGCQNQVGGMGGPKGQKHFQRGP